MLLLLLINLKYINYAPQYYNYYYLFIILCIFTIIPSTSSCGGSSRNGMTFKAINGRCPPDNNSGPTVGNRIE